jgi:hypothetical protein
MPVTLEFLKVYYHFQGGHTCGDNHQPDMFCSKRKCEMMETRDDKLHNKKMFLKSVSASDSIFTFFLQYCNLFGPY